MSRPRQIALWAGLIGVTVAFAHLPAFAHRLLDGDEAIYASIAALMNTGAPLYGAGGVDNKPPGIFWVYAATFQAAGTYQMTAVHAVGLAVILATCLLLFVIGRDLGGVRTGLLAALFYGILTAAGNPRLLATNTELFMMLPLVASVLLMLRRQWLWSGLLLVAAGAFRQVAAVDVLLAVAGILWLGPRGNRRGGGRHSLARPRGEARAARRIVRRRDCGRARRRRACPAPHRVARRFLALDGEQPVRLRLDQLDSQLRVAPREGQHRAVPGGHGRVVDRGHRARDTMAPAGDEGEAGCRLAGGRHGRIGRGRPSFVALLHPGHGTARGGHGACLRALVLTQMGGRDRCARHPAAGRRMVGLRPGRRPTDLRLQPSRAAARVGGGVHPRSHHAGPACVRVGRLARALCRVGPADGEPLSRLPSPLRARLGNSARQLGHET